MAWDGGQWTVLSPIDRAVMAVVASIGGGWDHVSVSRKNRVPNWAEMEHVKRLFFKDDETAMQLHVPPSDHVSFHPTVLHLWRPQRVGIPRPPHLMVGIPGETPKDCADAERIVAAHGGFEALEQQLRRQAGET
jgi:hypothetical protein